jgi:MtN3 and saliva related transmembrane protein
MDLTSVIGFLAGLLTTGANVPQVIKTYKNKSADDLSLRMVSSLAVGLALWIVYGFLTKSAPLIAANAAGFILVTALVVMKLKYSR